MCRWATSIEVVNKHCLLNRLNWDLIKKFQNKDQEISIDNWQAQRSERRTEALEWSDTDEGVLLGPFHDKNAKF